MTSATLAGLLAIAVPLLGWILLRARPRLAAALPWEAVWCMVSLVAKQWLMAADTRIVFANSTLALTFAAAAVPVALVALAGRSRIRPWLAWLVAVSGTIVMFADVLYFRYFGDIISAPVLLASRQTDSVVASAVSLLTWSDLWFALDLLAALPLLFTLTRLAADFGQARRWWPRAAVALACASLVTVTAQHQASSPEGAKALNQTFTNVGIVRQFGPLGYHGYDSWRYLQSRWLRTPLSDEERADVQAWFDARRPLREGKGPLFGRAQGRNLLVVQAESLQGFVVGMQINGQEVTPNLNRWWRDGLAFSSVTDQTAEGRTSDAEFSALTSLLPLERGSAAFAYATNRYVALPRVLRGRGYETLSAVPFDGSFWNRRTVHPIYGFSRSLFAESFEPGAVVGWGLNDRDFLRQMLPTLASLRQPFLAWLITLSLHHPYSSFPSQLETMNVGEWTGKPFGNYLHAMHHLDTALGELRAGLAASGLADNTVVVVFGDHDAGFAWEGPIARAAGFPAYILEWYLQDRVPWLVLVPGADAPRGEITLAGGQTDIAPTLLALLGIDPAPLPFMGRNLLGQTDSDVRVRPNGGWTDGHLFFDGETDDEARRCYDIPAREALPASACHAGLQAAERKRRVARNVLVHDIQGELGR